MRSGVILVTRYIKATFRRQFSSSICYRADLKDEKTNMSTRNYWEEFYHKKHPDSTSNDNFDWFFSYKVAKPWLLQHIQQQKVQLRQETDSNSMRPLQILELGCGTSNLSAELFTDEPSLHIQCVDFSDAAINTMCTRFKHLESDEGKNGSGLHYSPCDITNLPFADERFHVCYEKGTLDAVLKDRSYEAGKDKAIEVIFEVARVLNQGGLFLQFSDDPPELRLPILEKAKFDIETAHNRPISMSFKDIGCFSGIDFFIYVMNMNHRPR